MENDNNQQQGLQIDLKPEIAKGVYANLALITHSSSDFVLDFATMLPGMPKPEVSARVVMAPEHAKRLLQALQETCITTNSSLEKSQFQSSKSE